MTISSGQYSDAVNDSDEKKAAAGEFLLFERISGFSERLRAQGLLTGIREDMDALRALSVIGVEDRGLVLGALQTVYASSPRELAAVEQTFNDWFVDEETFMKNRLAEQEASLRAAALQSELEERLTYGGQHVHLREDLRDVYAQMPEEARERLKEYADEYAEKMGHAPKLYTGFIKSVFMKVLLEQQMLLEDAAEKAKRSDPESDLMMMNISNFTDDEIPRAYELIDRLTRRMRGEMNRRKRSHALTRAVDFKKTIRAGMSTGGTLYHLKFRRKPERKRRIVMLADVSASMLQFSSFTLRFVQAMSSMSNADIFLFSEETRRISTDELKNAGEMGEWVRTLGLWGRGTNIGAAIEHVLTASPPVLGSGSTLVILSDGKSVDMNRLETDMLRLGMVTGEVLWMNPIPQSKWPYLQSVQRLLPYCRMVPCSTLGELARACRGLGA